MKFHDCKTAPSPRRVRMFIAEKGLDIESREVNLRKQEQLGAGFLKLNPAGTVPVLETDDGTRFVTTAGCRAYLESAYPQPPLLGRNSIERGKVADCIWRIENDGFMAVAECLRNSAKGMKDRALPGPHAYAQNADLAERGRTRATRFLPELNRLIGDNAFVAGDTFSAADIDAFIFVEFSKWIKLELAAELGNIARWMMAMAARPSASQ